MGDLWGLSCPPRDETAFPSTDADVAITLIDDAIGSLVLSRGGVPGDDGAALSCLVSLISETESRLVDAVADAKDQDYTWDEIADRLATSTATARRRYAGNTRWRKSLGLEHDWVTQLGPAQPKGAGLAWQDHRSRLRARSEPSAPSRRWTGASPGW